jgi:hypothetical protein
LIPIVAKVLRRSAKTSDELLLRNTDKCAPVGFRIDFHFTPLYGLMVSRYRRGAVFLVHRGWGIAPNIAHQVIEVKYFASYPKTFVCFRRTDRTSTAIRNTHKKGQNTCQKTHTHNKAASAGAFPLEARSSRLLLLVGAAVDISGLS